MRRRPHEREAKLHLQNASCLREHRNRTLPDGENRLIKIDALFLRLFPPPQRFNSAMTRARPVVSH